VGEGRQVRGSEGGLERSAHKPLSQAWKSTCRVECREWVKTGKARVERAQISDGSRVADFCAGLGGTVRYLAHKYGADVTGIELTPARVARPSKQKVATSILGRDAQFALRKS
jgi:hypothetical protein